MANKPFKIEANPMLNVSKKETIEALKSLDPFIMRNVSRITDYGYTLLDKVKDIISEAEDAIKNRDLKKLEEKPASLIRLFDYFESKEKWIEGITGFEGVGSAYWADVGEIRNALIDSAEAAREGDWEEAEFRISVIKEEIMPKLYDDIDKMAIVSYRLLERAKEKLGEVV